MKKIIVSLLILFNAYFSWAGASRDFDGVSDSIDFTKPGSLVIGTDSFTRMVWFYWTDGGDSNEVIFSQQDGTGTGRSWLTIEDTATNCGTAQEIFSFLGNTWTCGSDISENVWYHGAVVSDEGAGTVILYLDGVQDASATRTVEAATGDLRTGVAKVVTTSDFEGQMAHHVLCEGALTADQIFEISINPEVSQRAYCIGNTLGYHPFWGGVSPEIDLTFVGTGTLTGTAESENGPPVMMGSEPL